MTIQQARIAAMKLQQELIDFEIDAKLEVIKISPAGGHGLIQGVKLTIVSDDLQASFVISDAGHAYGIAGAASDWGSVFTADKPPNFEFDDLAERIAKQLPVLKAAAARWSRLMAGTGKKAKLVASVKPG